MRLIFLQRQDIIRLLIDNPRRNLFLAAHRIDGDDASGQAQHLEQVRDRCDLIRLVIDFALSQGQMMLHRPGTHHVNRRKPDIYTESPVEEADFSEAKPEDTAASRSDLEPTLPFPPSSLKRNLPPFAPKSSEPDTSEGKREDES